MKGLILIRLLSHKHVNTYVKNQSSSTHCSKVISKMLKNVSTNGKFLPLGIFINLDHQDSSTYHQSS